MSAAIPIEIQPEATPETGGLRAGKERRRPELSIVIPVYNEERLVLDVLRLVAAVPLEKELVVVNDCSKDGTKAVLDGIEKDALQIEP